jgi:glutamate synthase domain-containing protein 3
MTGGVAIILGHTGRNFAAGMGGGVAYVLDETGDFGDLRCNLEMVDLDPIVDEDVKLMLHMIRKHVDYTGSPVGKRILDNWDDYLPKFIKVMPRDYKRVIGERMKREAEKVKAQSPLAGAGV